MLVPQNLRTISLVQENKIKSKNLQEKKKFTDHRM